MFTKIISGPAFIYDAMLGLGLSYGTTSDMELKTLMKRTDVFNSLITIAKKLAWKQGGHNKFLETITLCLDITAPRYWWQEFDTYRVGVTKQSESTMHTITNKPFETTDFESGCTVEVLKLLNTIREGLIDVKGPVEDDKHDFEYLKNYLPEGYLQRRIVTLNLKTLQNIWTQRCTHRLPEWKMFFTSIMQDLECHPQYDFIMWCLFKIDKEEN